MEPSPIIVLRSFRTSDSRTLSHTHCWILSRNIKSRQEFSNFSKIPDTFVEFSQKVRCFADIFDFSLVLVSLGSNLEMIQM